MCDDDQDVPLLPHRRVWLRCLDRGGSVCAPGRAAPVGLAGIPRHFRFRSEALAPRARARVEDQRAAQRRRCAARRMCALVEVPGGYLQLPGTVASRVRVPSSAVPDFAAILTAPVAVLIRILRRRRNRRRSAGHAPGRILDDARFRRAGLRVVTRIEIPHSSSSKRKPPQRLTTATSGTRRTLPAATSSCAVTARVAPPATRGVQPRGAGPHEGRPRRRTRMRTVEADAGPLHPHKRALMRAGPDGLGLRKAGRSQYTALCRSRRRIIEATKCLRACTLSMRRDGRVVDGGGLENHCTRKGTGGSNPSLSARLRSPCGRASSRQASPHVGEVCLAVVAKRAKATRAAVIYQRHASFGACSRVPAVRCCRGARPRRSRPSHATSS